MPAGPSLYRRHRPRTFADVVGQEHVVRTLSHAVQRDKVHHAYLFVGSRGTGKTSMAKILASCLNCVNGPTVSPCGVCDSCVSIANATSLDVIEMDAASNNSVDDIRELRETVAYAPVSGRHKVYILDEAHMLSSQAWNAFLKTLEEPPPSTVFVLATTEAQKVLPTVVDRCHRFDFGRPAADQIAGLLRRVAGVESIALDDGAAALIARHATGSYRDALGTLEQLVDYAGDAPILPADVLAVLGVADAEQLFAAVDAVIARDPGAVLGAAAALSASGRDPGQVLRDLESHARELLTCQIIGEVPPELAVTPDRDARLLAQAVQLAPTDAVRLLDLVSVALEATANGAQPRIQLELVLIRAAAPEVDPSVSALLSRIERLEQGGAARGGSSPASSGLAASPVSAASPAPAASVTAAVAPAPSLSVSPAAPNGDRAGSGTDEHAASAVRGTPAAPPSAASAPTAPPSAASAPAAPPSAASAPAAPAHVEDVAVLAPSGEALAPGAAPAPTGSPQDSAGAEMAAAAEPASAVEAGPAPRAHAVSALDTGPDPVEPQLAEAPPAPPGPAHVGLGTTDLVQMQELWPAVIELVRGQNQLLAALLHGTRPMAVSERQMTVGLPAGAAFVKRKLDTNEPHRRMTAEAVHSVTGATLELTYQLADAAAPESPGPAAPDDKLSEAELVRRFVEEFDAQELKEDQETS